MHHIETGTHAAPEFNGAHVSRVFVRSAVALRILCSSKLLLTPVTLCVLVALAGAQQATFEEVVRDLSHRDAGVRVAAMRALVQGGHPQAIEPIARLIGDPVDAVQLEAIFSVVSFYAGEQAPTRRRIGGVFEMRGSRGPEAAFLKGPYIVAPLQVPAGVPSALVAALRDDSDRVRADALYAIAIVNPAPAARAVTDPMVPLLGDASPLVRVAAARALGRLRAQGAGVWGRAAR
jgi:HEAT repeat protein